MRYVTVYVCLCFVTFSQHLAANEDRFLIGPGDAIEINVYNESDLRVKAKVGASGIIRIPLIGNVTVIGKTPKQLGSELEAAFDDGYLVNPSVSVVIAAFRPFYIRGSVNKPGSYSFEFDMTVDQAIAVAGGLKDRASKTKWTISRGPEKQKLTATPETSVFPGDIIEIKESFF